MSEVTGDQQLSFNRQNQKIQVNIHDGMLEIRGFLTENSHVLIVY